MPKKRKPLSDSPARWKRIEKIYGLTKEDYQKILQDQRGICFICQRNPEQIKPRRHLAVDHCHTTGKIRGLLCFNCNHKLLGWYLRDNIATAKRIVEYLERTVSYGKINNNV
jgi:hypothetical protein